MLDLEMGKVVFIPRMLSLDQFPISYNFYDPILFYLHDNIAENIKQNLLCKIKLRLQEIREENFLYAFEFLMGGGDKGE